MENKTFNGEEDIFSDFKKNMKKHRFPHVYQTAGLESLQPGPRNISDRFPHVYQTAGLESLQPGPRNISDSRNLIHEALYGRQNANADLFSHLYQREGLESLQPGPRNISDSRKALNEALDAYGRQYANAGSRKDFDAANRHYPFVKRLPYDLPLTGFENLHSGSLNIPGLKSQNARSTGVNIPRSTGAHVPSSTRALVPRSTGALVPHKRGYVLVIINNYHIEKSRGTEIDEIRDIFENYGYGVKGFLNAKTSKMIGYILRYSREACSGTFICFISSHGSRTTLQSGTKSPIRLAAILDLAYDKNQCRTNVFFIDACRGTGKETILKDDIPDIQYPEYFVGYSCLGLTSARVGNGYCGLYFEVLIKVFEEEFPKPLRDGRVVRNINYLMEKVRKSVSGIAKRRGYDNQIPETQSTLTRELFLQGDDD